VSAFQGTLRQPLQLLTRHVLEYLVVDLRHERACAGQLSCAAKSPRSDAALEGDRRVTEVRVPQRQNRRIEKD
jgi:hypothetical protein